MKVGDLVRVPQAKCNGIIIEIDDSHRQKVVTVLTEHGYFLENIWDAHVSLIEDRVPLSILSCKIARNNVQ